MSSVEELKLDVNELKKLLEITERIRVKNVLTSELHKIQTAISVREEQMKVETPGNDEAQPVSKIVKPSQKRLPTVEIKTYAWDQSDKFMKIYATVPGVESVPKEQVTCEFTDRSFHLHCENVQKKNYDCKVACLMEDIVTDGSYIKIKTDMVLVMLKKKETSKTWPYVTEREKKSKDKNKPTIDETKDPNDSLMGMMKQMYDDGDDEMKRTIAKAWSESRQKQGGM